MRNIKIYKMMDQQHWIMLCQLKGKPNAQVSRHCGAWDGSNVHSGTPLCVEVVSSCLVNYLGIYGSMLCLGIMVEHDLSRIENICVLYITVSIF